MESKGGPSATPHDGQMQEGEGTFTTLSSSQKRYMISMATIGACFSPLASNMYYPALNTLAHDLSVNNTLINLTLTSYMVVQALAPIIIGPFSDTSGRRPAYFVCFTLFIAANIGLAVQSNYVALLALRCLQSGGSSATGALANAVIADITTSSERGTAIGYTFAGAFIGQSLGPLLGGALSQFATWRWIFWFLAIFSSAFFLPFALFAPETCRVIVGPSPMPTWFTVRVLRMSKRNILASTAEFRTTGPKRFHLPNPLISLRLCKERGSGIILLSGGLIFAAQAVAASALPSQLASKFNFDDFHIGLSCIPMGVGSVVASVFVGKLLDINYRRHASINVIAVSESRQPPNSFPFETARLEVALPGLYLMAGVLVGYGWILQVTHSVPGILICLFLLGCFGTTSFNALSILLVDLCPSHPGAASAANNLLRCILGAGGSAMIVPLIERVGVGWAYTLVGSILALASPLIWGVKIYGLEWRNQ